jgi:universal stress protein A
MNRELNLPKTAETSRVELYEAISLKRILVPVDFSESSLKALHYATTLASEFGSEIYLVNVVPPFLSGDVFVDLAALQSTVRRNAKREIQNLCKSVGVNCKGNVREGGPADEIVEEAKEIKADLIIIGTHGRTGLPRALIGSVAERVVRLAPCPTLVVREKEREFIDLNPASGESQRSREEEYEN